MDEAAGACRKACQRDGNSVQPSMDIGLAVSESHQAAGYVYKTVRVP